MTAPTLGFRHTYAEQLDGAYVPHAPMGFPEPALLHLNEPLLATLDVDADRVRSRAAGLFSGTVVPADARPIALAYAGHQFGGLSPQLGDGRAVLLGELPAKDGTLVDVQLKGSGPTAFSRGGDGRATLGPILRELLVSEAMAHLGVPTTRVLAAVTTGERVRRDGLLPGAVLARTAASHLRVGTFQFFAMRQDLAMVKRLVTYTLDRHAPGADRSDGASVALLHHVATVQAELIAGWMAHGFVHGVMNTDNTALSGETIDYGPCAFLEAYDPTTVFSSIDHGGRYAYGNQPRIGQWNLARFAETVLPLLADDEDAAVARAQEALDHYASTYDTAFLRRMVAKIGLREVADGDRERVEALLDWMAAQGADFTSAFRELSAGLVAGAPYHADPAYVAWFADWRARLGGEDPAAVAARMDAVNPIYIPRNHLVEDALAAAHDGDLAPFERLLAAVRAPCTDRPADAELALPAPDSFGAYQTFCGT
jgi:uncharacterized protein YdiU (UPF0061 family)